MCKWFIVTKMILWIVLANILWGNSECKVTVSMFTCTLSFHGPVFIIWFCSCKQHIPVGFSELGLFQMLHFPVELCILWTCKQCIEVGVFLVPLDFSLYDPATWFSLLPHTIFCKACRTFKIFLSILLHWPISEAVSSTSLCKAPISKILWFDGGRLISM